MTIKIILLNQNTNLKTAFIVNEIKLQKVQIKPNMIAAI